MLELRYVNQIILIAVPLKPASQFAHILPGAQHSLRRLRQPHDAHRPMHDLARPLWLPLGRDDRRAHAPRNQRRRQIADHRLRAPQQRPESASDEHDAHRLTTALNRRSNWRVTNNIGDIVEVSVIACQVNQIMAIHYRHDQSVIRKKTVLTADLCSFGQLLLSDKDNTQPELCNLLNSLLKPTQLLKLLPVPP